VRKSKRKNRLDLYNVKRLVNILIPFENDQLIISFATIAACMYGEAMVNTTT
jgi:hypothetical protein